ncbi:transporter [Rufibacter latericius]|uniref:Transporter n=1 Tax=Rufibacter latericius TaxID=2487040 RepID=A0A3M9MTX9_9BACT|nr:transporter [Rufibacter latericius]RNI28971.1 transporter [Rufibacter latericius]
MKTFTLLTLLLLPSLCFGQAVLDSTKAHSPLQTDRPDQTEASSVVPRGTFQFENGFQKQVTNQKGLRSEEYLYPSTLIRWGVLDRMELRLITELRQSRLNQERSRLRAAGLNAIAVGTKIYVTEEKGLLPEISFIGHLTLPSGSSEFRPAFVAPEIRFSLSHTLTDKLSLGYNLGYEWDGDTPTGTGIYTLALGTDFSDRWGSYIELFGEKPENLNWSHSADGGITFSPWYNIQFDFSAAIGISENAPDYYLGAGMSFRIPR